MSPPGDIRAYDVLTGKLVWTFHTVPRPGEFGYDTWPKDAYKYIGGNNTWGEMTVDTRRGIAYIPLGSPTYDFYGADRIGANLFGTSIVALDARTGKRLWHFQIVHHDLWDLDPSAAPQLTTIRHNGRNRDVVVVTSKTGWLYVLRPRDRRADLADRRAPGAEERDAGRRELADAAVPDQARSRTSSTRSASRTSARICRPRRPRPSRSGCSRPTTRASSRRSASTTRCTCRRATAARSSAARPPDPAPARVYVVAHDNPGILRLLRPGEGRGGGPPVAAGTARLSAELPGVPRPGPPRNGNRRAARAPGGRPGQQHRGRRAALRRGRHPRTVLATGKGRMPAFPHLTARMSRPRHVPDGSRGGSRAGAAAAVAAAPVRQDPAHRRS